MSLNRLRDLAAAKSAAIGTFVSMGNMSEVECLGYTGLDFVVIDTEHGPFDTETMMNLIRAAELVHLVPVGAWPMSTIKTSSGRLTAELRPLFYLVFENSMILRKP